MWKLRTMWGAENESRGNGIVEYLRDPYVPADKSVADPRVTHSLGRWLRRYSVDELPQLFHVLKGQMALAGPRPLTRNELTTYYGANAAEVLSVKPGISGLWQVSGRDRLTYKQRLEFDLSFVRNLNWRLYCGILVRTVPAVFRRDRRR